MYLINDFSLWLIILLMISQTTAEINLSPYASWEQNATTVDGLGNGGSGSSLTALDTPFSISITTNDILYISDTNNNRIVVVDLTSHTNISIIGSGPGTSSTQFDHPYGLFIKDTSLYVIDFNNYRIQKSSLNGSNPSTIPGISSSNGPYYLYVDNGNNIYLSDTLNHRVLFFPYNSTTFTTVAGNSTSGSLNSQLNQPYGIFVNRNGTLYIADYNNHRIMKWYAGATSGIIIAGNGASGSFPTPILYPAAVLVDTNEYLYTSEITNVRIMRWAPNSTIGVCIAACTISIGTAAYQLNSPSSIAFDSKGSLYVNDRYNHRIQKFQIISQYQSPSYNQPKFSSCATWDTNGITIANSITVGSNPFSMFVSTNNTIYVVAQSLNAVLVWFEGSNTPIWNISNGLNNPYGIFATINGDIYVDNGDVNHRVDKWSWNSTSSIAVMNVNNKCFSLFVDTNDNLYCSQDAQHQVLKIQLNSGSNTSSLVAGIGASGSSANMLNTPNGIFIDTNFDLYVADYGNDRIQLFPSGQLNATTVANSQMLGSITLNGPNGVMLDADGNLFILEWSGRIIRSGSSGAQCLIACTGISGSASNKLNGPHSINFDSYGNIYVADTGNRRIQKFVLMTNSCSPSYNQPKFFSCATWNPNAVTIANVNLFGSLTNAIWVNMNNTIYVAATNTSCIYIWLEGHYSTPTGNYCIGLVSPTGVFFTTTGDSYVEDNSNAYHQILKWSLHVTNSTIVMYAPGSCNGFFVDKYNNIYCSLAASNQIIKRSFADDAHNFTIIAGNSTMGSTPNLLNNPHGIWVDVNLNLYVADCYNHRIQFFQSGQMNATTLAGIGSNGTISLLYPETIVLDADGNLFIIDGGNNRIIGSFADGFRCIVGCSRSAGNGPNELNQPHSLSFDSYGNLFITDTYNNRIQQFLLATNTCDIAFNQPKFCPSATWNPNGITFTNISTMNDIPSGIFIDINNTVYQSLGTIDAVQVWLEGMTIPIRNISGDLNSTYSVFVTTNGNIYIDNGLANGRVDVWTPNTTNSTPAMYVTDGCYDLFVDINNNIYCSHFNSHQVIKQSLHNPPNSSVIAAGTGASGSASNMLHNPRGIIVDTNLNLYVADCSNNRIQRFASGSLNGTTIIGIGINATITLQCPIGIVMDADGFLFISDHNNNRVIGSDMNGLRCIVGCSNISGSASDQFNRPWGLRFDNHGSLFVVDWNNYRIQKFLLATNSCNQSTITTRTTAQSTSISTTYSTGFTPPILNTTSIPSTTTNMSTTTVYQNSTNSAQCFIPNTCLTSTSIGSSCNISTDQCSMLQPCQNHGTCINNNTVSVGYSCSCPPGFNGTRCQYDNRPCQLTTCWHNSTCNQTSITTFVCSCRVGWEGIYCETMINYCENISCWNKGVCQPSFLNFTCQCIDVSYSGRYCEITSNKLAIRQAISKSFAYIAIIVMLSAAMFIFILDILKYCFGINPTKKTIMKKKYKKKKKTKYVIAVRFIYVHAPST